MFCHANDSSVLYGKCDARNYRTGSDKEILTKRQYQHITGRQQTNDIIAYQIRQSFKPGEVTPEEANQVGYETAMRWTKGKHAFLVATHIDKVVALSILKNVQMHGNGECNNGN